MAPLLYDVDPQVPLPHNRKRLEKEAENMLTLILQWGIPALFAGFLGYHFSPIYRNLTFQFKLYLQMSAMTVGGTIEADRRFRDAEKNARRLRRLRQDQEAWRRFEADYEDERLK